jgi:hypothetical protein
LTPRTPGGGVFGAGILKPKSPKTSKQQPGASLPAMTVQNEKSAAGDPTVVTSTASLGGWGAQTQGVISNAPATGGWGATKQVQPTVNGTSTGGWGANPTVNGTTNAPATGAATGTTNAPATGGWGAKQDQPTGDQAAVGITTGPYAPKARPVNDLFSEDAENVDEYRHIADYDCKITISGGSGPNHVTMEYVLSTLCAMTIVNHNYIL